MHPLTTRQQALDMLAGGTSRRDVARQLGVGYNSTYRWQARINPSVLIPRCFRCDGSAAPAAYGYLLGQYLGDGHVATVNRTTALRIYCCDAYPQIMDEVATAMRTVANVSVNRRQLAGCTQIQSATNHWRCLLPQHGPGMKHLRLIALQDWQREVIATDPRPLIRGLIQSDGCRAMNTVHRSLPSGTRTYSYPRYFFSNMSADIQAIFTAALDQLGIAWRQNRFNSISVARGEAVAALDAFVGPKA
jgi:Homeodomain-like domain-containing protein